MQGKSRSAVMNEAAESYLERLETAEMIRQINKFVAGSDADEESKEREVRRHMARPFRESMNKRGLTWDD